MLLGLVDVRNIEVKACSLGGSSKESLADVSGIDLVDLLEVATAAEVLKHVTLLVVSNAVGHTLDLSHWLLLRSLNGFFHDRSPSHDGILLQNHSISEVLNSEELLLLRLRELELLQEHVIHLIGGLMWGQTTCF